MTHYGARERSFRGRTEKPYSCVKITDRSCHFGVQTVGYFGNQNNVDTRKRAHEAPFRYIQRDTSRREFLRYRRARHVLSKSALVTTLTLENAMAAPASMGLSRPKAASGMPIRL